MTHIVFQVRSYNTNNFFSQGANALWFRKINLELAKKIS